MAKRKVNVMSKRNDSRSPNSGFFRNLVQDRLNAKGIVGCQVEEMTGEAAKRLYVTCGASHAGYNLENYFAVLVRRNTDCRESLFDLKQRLDPGFVGVVPGFNEAIVNEEENSLVWFFEIEDEKVCSEPVPVSLVPPPSSVQPSIPSWFKDTIDKICADGVPYLSVEEVQVTLDLSPKDVGRYAKTYAPRSFSEGVLVGRELLPREFCQALSKRTDVSILDVGCGMAAFSLGVIHGLDRGVIEKDNACSVCLDLIDGNPFMLERARDFIAAHEKICVYGVSSVRTKYEERKIVDVSDCFQKTHYDLIMTSKFLGELVCRGWRDAFKDFLEESVQHIRVGGQVVLVEIPKHRELIESAVRSLLKSGFRVAVRDIEVKPTFVGTESKDSETVVVVFLTK